MNELAKNGLYGNECVKAAETAKKSKFSDQLKLLQQNVNTVDENTLKGGTLGGTNDYNNIFADLEKKAIIGMGDHLPNFIALSFQQRLINT